MPSDGSNPLRALHERGQSVWLDHLDRGLILDGGLERLVREDGLSGVTSNPTIFGKALSGSDRYDEEIRRARDAEPMELFYRCSLGDVIMAADVLRPVYDATGGADGFVSFELDPNIAEDTDATIESARALHERAARPNVMFKVPGTEAGVGAVEALIALGINVNITLLFSVDRYEEVARAYVAGLEQRHRAGEPLGVASVASFFVSRVDTAVDERLPPGSPLRGRTAVANAKIAYQRFLSVFAGERWDALAAAGARRQRPLWASTGTKDPAYSDVLYVEELVAPDTVNTMPEKTLDAFRDHGIVRGDTALEEVEEAEKVLAALPEHGIDLDAVTDGLLDAGLAAFRRDLAAVLERLDAERARV